MSYNVFYNKQAPRGVLESPQSDLGFTQAPQTNQDILNTQNVGTVVGAARLYGAAKQLISTEVAASGNKRLKKNVERVSTGIGILTEIKAFGLKGAILIEALSFATEVYANERQNTIDIINQTYEQQKNGVAVKQFVGEGVRID